MWCCAALLCAVAVFGRGGVVSCDVVFGVRVTDGDRTDPKVERFLVCDEVRGWKGKVRDPNRKIEAVMRTADITEIFKLMTKPNKKEAA